MQFQQTSPSIENMLEFRRATVRTSRKRNVGNPPLVPKDLLVRSTADAKLNLTQRLLTRYLLRDYRAAVRAGLRLIREHSISLIYACGDPFTALMVGARLKSLTGLPLVFGFEGPMVYARGRWPCDQPSPHAQSSPLNVDSLQGCGSGHSEHISMSCRVCRALSKYSAGTAIDLCPE